MTAPLSNDSPLSWAELTTLHGWTEAEFYIDKIVSEHTRHVLEALPPQPDNLPPETRGWYECSLRAGLALALSVHYDDGIKSACERVARTWAHAATIAIKMSERIVRE